MGRMNPVPLEATTGATAAAVNVAHDRYRIVGPVLPVRRDRAARIAQLQSASEQFVARLKLSVDPDVFDVWLEQVRLLDADNGQLWLGAPSDVASWLRARFVGLLEGVASDLAGRPIEVLVVGEASGAQLGIETEKGMA